MINIKHFFSNADNSWKNFTHRILISHQNNDGSIKQGTFYISTMNGIRVKKDNEMFSPLIMKDDIEVFKAFGKSQGDMSKASFITAGCVILLLNFKTLFRPELIIFLVIAVALLVYGIIKIVKSFNVTSESLKQMKDLKNHRPMIRLPKKTIRKSWINLFKNQLTVVGTALISEGVDMMEEAELSIIWETVDQKIDKEHKVTDE